MKQVTLWQCYHCGTQYSDKKSCELCESTHTPPVKIGTCKYIPYKNDKTGYPVAVELIMNDGKTVVYRR